MKTTLDAINLGLSVLNDIMVDGPGPIPILDAIDALREAKALEEAKQYEAVPCEVCAMRSAAAISEIEGAIAHEEAQTAEPVALQPRACFTPDIWRVAEWAIPLHIHPLETDTWEVPNCAGDWKAPTPERVRRYIAQAIYKYASGAKEVQAGHPAPPPSTKRDALIERLLNVAQNPVNTSHDRARAKEAADMLAADAQDEWHRGRAAGIEECERVNAELKKLAQQVAVPKGELAFREADALLWSPKSKLQMHRVLAAPQPPQADTPPQRHPMTCTWTEDDEGYYATACGEAFVFNDGTPAQNHAVYCHHCGGKIEVKP